MNSRLSQIIRTVLTNIDVILIAFLSFILIRFIILTGDYDWHTMNILNYACFMSYDFYQPHFLLFKFVSYITFQTCDYWTILLTLEIVVSIFIGLKYAIIKRLISNEIPKYTPVVIFFTLFLSIFISIPNYLFIKQHWLYLYVINGNCWHNSTFLVTLPFSILLFYKSFDLINLPNAKNILIVSLLIFVNVFTKPNYFLAFLTVFPLFTFYYNRFSKKFFLSLLPVTLGIAFLAFQFFYAKAFIYNDGTKGITIDFFALFEPHYGSIWIFLFSLIFTFAFPITFFLFNKNCFFDKEVIFCLLTTIVSLVLVLVFVENSDRLSAGNFLWGLMASINIFFTVTTILLIRKYKSQKFDFGLYIPLAVLCLHYFFGGAYILKIILKGWYM